MARLKLLGLDNWSSPSSSGLGLSSLTDGLVGNALGSALGSQTETLRTTGFAPPAVDSTTTGSGQTQTVQLTQNAGGHTPATSEQTDETPTQRKRPVAEIIERLGNSVSTPSPSTATGTSTSRPNALGDAVKQASDGVKKTVDSVNDGLTKAVSDVSKAVSDTAKKMSDAAKPKADSGAAE